MFFKRIFILLFAAIFLLPGSQLAFAESEIPTPVGDIYVQDFANVLSPNEKQQLIGLGRAVENKTGAQIAVLTVDSTGDMEMPEYAIEAFRSYGIGSKERDDGVLLVVALNDRNIRIEVGYGLEGTIPDGKAGRILDTYAIPHFQAGQPNVGIVNTYKALANEVTGELIQGEGAEPASQPQGFGIPTWLIIVIVVGLVVLDFMFFGGTLSFFLLSILSRGGIGGGGGGSRGGGGGSSGGGGAGRSW